MSLRARGFRSEDRAFPRTTASSRPIKEPAKAAKQEDTYIDGQGKEVAIDKARKKASKADLKKIKKAVAAKRKAGEECYTDEELENAGFLAEY